MRVVGIRTGKTSIFKHEDFYEKVSRTVLIPTTLVYVFFDTAVPSLHTSAAIF